MKQPLVSVVLPVFNGMPYLPQSIESVLNQTFQDWELLVYDDGSTDQSWETIHKYQDKRIRVYSHFQNQGLFKTLNAGIQEARGELIRLWSQDDLMKPNCLQLEVEFNSRHPEIAMSYCQYDLIDEWSRLVQPAKCDETPEVISPLLANQIMFYHGSITGNIANVTIRRQTFDRVGLFREDMPVAGDFEMWVRICQTYPIGFLRQPLIRLRSHRGQFSKRKGITIQFMRECRGIHQELIRRLPSELLPYARKYYRRHHLILYTHYMLRCLLVGDLRLFFQVYQELARMGNPLLLTWFLIGTLDKRILQLRPKYTSQPMSGG